MSGIVRVIGARVPSITNCRAWVTNTRNNMANNQTGYYLLTFTGQGKQKCFES
jgi:hypothetical protein